MFGTPTTTHPAAIAERDTGRGVLDRDAVGRVDAERSAAPAGTARGAACRARHLVAGDDDVERDRRQLGERSGRRGAATTSSRARTARRASLSSASSRRAPGRHGTCSRTRAMTPSSIRSTISCGSQVDAAVVAQYDGRVEQVEPDHRVGVLVGPRAAERVDELALAREPVRLGVDERAVHVPQDGGGRPRPESSASVRSLLHELDQRAEAALRVDEGDGRAPAARRGAWSIGVAPAAIIAAQRRGAVVDPVADVVQALAALLERLGDRRVVAGRPRSAGCSCRRPSAGPPRHRRSRRSRGGATVAPNASLVVVDGGLEVVDGDGHVVDLGQQHGDSLPGAIRVIAVTESVTCTPVVRARSTRTLRTLGMGSAARGRRRGRG